MSTRCQIAFYENEKEKDLSKFNALVYRHSDGYPGSIEKGKEEYGVLADILPFLQWFKKKRGLKDMEYTSARLLQWLCNEYDEMIDKTEEKIARQEKKKREFIFTGILGHGISKNFHGDIEFLFAIYPNRVDVFETEFDMEGTKDINKIAKKIKTIKFD